MQLYVSTSTLPLQHRYNGHPHTNHFRHLGIRDVVRDDFGKFWKVPGIPFTLMQRHAGMTLEGDGGKSERKGPHADFSESTLLS